MQWLELFNTVTGLIFSLFFFYQYVYIVIGLIKKPRIYPDVPKTNRFAVLISARNESAVIGQLCDSIRAQDYPQELIDICVVADNCTDNTKEIAEAHGAIVYERFDSKHVGKGYALNFLLGHLKKDKGADYYDGYFVIDADNLLDPHYITEMNKCFSAGNRIITSYRNSKNYGDNWISAGYSLWFMREARYLNNVRNLIGASCAVSGTGFMFHKDILKEIGGNWKYYLLTEDIEFTIDSVLHDEKIAYCHTAMLYDEQPTRFSQSWRQRKRWAKGFLQVLRHYGLKLLGGLFRKASFSCYDMLMTISPALFITLLSLIINVGAAVYAAFANPALLPSILFGLGFTAVFAYSTLFIMGVVTLITEWKKIRTSAFRKIFLLLLFPFFIFTYLPISISALVSHTEWKPIAHTVSLSVEELTENKDKDPIER